MSVVSTALFTVSYYGGMPTKVLCPFIHLYTHTCSRAVEQIFIKFDIEDSKSLSITGSTCDDERAFLQASTERLNINGAIKVSELNFQNITQHLSVLSL
jgi:hypothetical protein